MKKILFSIMLSLFVLNVFGQPASLSKEDYLLKSERQRKTGWVLLVGGTTMMIVGAIVGDGNDSDELGYGSSFDTGMWLFGIGLTADLASIPLFIGSASNARKAAAISFKNQRILGAYPIGYALKFQPAITLTINLK